MSTTRFFIRAEQDVVQATLAARRYAENQGFDDLAQTGIATVVSELGHNIVKYAGRGHITLTFISEPTRAVIEIEARDSGPGIENVEQALADHFSSSGTLGLGLPGVKRLVDEFEIQSAPGEGTCVLARKWRT